MLKLWRSYKEKKYEYVSLFRKLYKIFNFIQSFKDVLTNMISNTDRKLEFIDRKLNSHPVVSTKKQTTEECLKNSELTSLTEFQLLKKNLSSLKKNPQLLECQFAQSKIQEIEDNMVALINRIHTTIQSSTSFYSSSGSSSLTSSSTNSPVIATKDIIHFQPVLEEQTVQTSPSFQSLDSSSSSSISSNLDNNTPHGFKDEHRLAETNINGRKRGENYGKNFSTGLKRKQTNAEIADNQLASKNEHVVQRGFKEYPGESLVKVSTSSSTKPSSTSNHIHNSAVEKCNFIKCEYYFDESQNPNITTIFKK